MISMISHSRKGKTMEAKKKKKKGQWLQGRCRERERGRAQRIFRAVRILYGIRMIDSGQNTFIQTHRMFNTKSELC